MKILLRIFSILFFITSVSASFQIDDIKINNRSCPFENGHYTYTPSVGNPLQFKIENQQTVFGTTRIIFSGDAEGTLEAPLSYKEEPLTFSDLNYDPATKVSDYIEQLRQHTHTTATYVWNENKQVRWGTLRPVIFFSRTAPLTFYDEWALKHDEKGHISHLEVPYQVGEESRGALRIHRFCHGVSSTPEKDCFYHDGHRLKSVALAVYSLGQTEWRQANGIANDYSYQSVEHSQVVAHALGSVLGGRGYVRLKSQKNMPCSYLHIGANGAYSIPHQQEAKAKRLELIHQAGENPVFTEEAGDVTFNYVQDSGMPVDVGSVTVQGNRREGFYHLSETAGSDAIAQTWTRQFMPSGSHIIKMTGKERPFQLVDLSRFLANSLSGKNAAEILGFFRPHRGEQPYVKTIRADFSHLPRDSQKKATQKLVQIREKSPNSYQYRDLKELFFEELNENNFLILKELSLNEPFSVDQATFKMSEPEVLNYLNGTKDLWIKRLHLSELSFSDSNNETVANFIKNNQIKELSINFTGDFTPQNDLTSFEKAVAQNDHLEVYRPSHLGIWHQGGNRQEPEQETPGQIRRKLLNKTREVQTLGYHISCCDSCGKALRDVVKHSQNTLTHLDLSRTSLKSGEWLRLIRSIAHARNLEVLKIDHTNLENEQVLTLSKGLVGLENLKEVALDMPYVPSHLCDSLGAAAEMMTFPEVFLSPVVVPILFACGVFDDVGTLFQSATNSSVCQGFQFSKVLYQLEKLPETVNFRLYTSTKLNPATQNHFRYAYKRKPDDESYRSVYDRDGFKKPERVTFILR